jgi:hypothetical protein
MESARLWRLVRRGVRDRLEVEPGNLVPEVVVWKVRNRPKPVRAVIEQKPLVEFVYRNKHGSSSHTIFKWPVSAAVRCRTAVGWR